MKKLEFINAKKARGYKKNFYLCGQSSNHTINLIMKRRILMGATAALLGLSALPSGATNAVFMHSPMGYQIIGMSPNGKWACGVYSDAMLTPYAFRWNLESGKIEMLGTTAESIAWAIADDGTIAGNFSDATALGNGAPVQMPGYHRDGKWHAVEKPEGLITDGLGYGISQDGRYLSGSIEINGIFTPFIWEDGQIYRNLNTGKDAMPYCISPDGQSAAGWSMQYNRTSVYWPYGADPVYLTGADTKAGITEPPYLSQTFASHAQKFSPDGSKLLYWGGWDPDEENHEVSLFCLYDIATGEEISLKAPSYESDIEYFDITDNGTLLGANQGRGVVYHDGEVYDIDTYLRDIRGVENLDDFDDFAGSDLWASEQIPVFRSMCISADESVIGLLYYNTLGQLASLIVKIDQPEEGRTVADLKIKQLEGLRTVALNWDRPVGMTVRGYNIYRDGAKINGFLPLQVPYYYDKNVALGEHTYEVGLINGANEEVKTEPFTVNVAEGILPAPQAIYARQKGVNGAYVTWNEPWSTLAHKHYFNEDLGEIEEFNVYQAITMEGAICFPKLEMDQYKGSTISEVSFYPMGEQNAWRVAVYSRDTDGTLTQLALQDVTQPLYYGIRNTVKLDTPVEIPSADVLVAIQVDANGYNSVMGAQNNIVVEGYSDLLRQGTEDPFFSAKASTEEQGYTVTTMAWAIDMGVSTGNTEPVVLTGYTVTLDGESVATTGETARILNGLDAGEHTLGVIANFEGAGTSEAATTTLAVVPEYPSVDKVNVSIEKDTENATFTWEAPADDDRTSLSYTTAETAKRGVAGVSENGYAIQCGVVFPKDMIRGYEDYTVKSFRFYPLCDALFTVLLYENNELIHIQEVESVELNKWNEIVPADEITLMPNAEYFLVIDCFDPVPAAQVMAVDGEMPFPYRSELYSITDGESWNSLFYETSLKGNWMIGMDILDPMGEQIPVEGYDVRVDGEKVNGGLLTETAYTHTFSTDKSSNHTVAVDVKYNELEAVVEGDDNVFFLTTGIGSAIDVSDITLLKGSNYLEAVGEGVNSITVTSTGGLKAAYARGNRVDISNLSPGIYLVTVSMGKRVVTRKIQIR